MLCGNFGSKITYWRYVKVFAQGLPTHDAEILQRDNGDVKWFQFCMAIYSGMSKAHDRR